MDREIFDILQSLQFKKHFVGDRYINGYIRHQYFYDNGIDKYMFTKYICRDNVEDYYLQKYGDAKTEVKTIIYEQDSLTFKVKLSKLFKEELRDLKLNQLL